MYVRVVFFMCDGRQLLDEMNVVLSSLMLCCIVRCRGDDGERGQFQSVFSFTSQIGVLIFVCQ